MVNDIAVQDFVNAIKETPTDTNTTYQATVSRIDDEGVVWVCIHGSDKETPTASTSSEVKRGDVVTVQWRSNKLYIGGNYSNPSAGFNTVSPAVDYVAELVDKDITVKSINAATGYIKDLTSENITTENIIATNGYIKELTADHITASDISVATGYIGDLTADHISASDISAATGFIGDLTAGNITAQNVIADHATVGSLDADYAQIDAANVTALSAQNAWVNKLMVQTGLLAHEGTVFTLDAIQVNAANITAGTLDVNRLIVTVDGQKYLVDIDPSTGTPSYEKLDGNIVEPRTITADKIVAHDITVQEITTENLVGTNGWINLNQGKFFYGNGANYASSTNAIDWNGTTLKIKGDIGDSVVFNNYSTTQEMNTAIGDAVDGIEIGGRNLLIDTDAPSVTKVHASTDRYISNASAAGYTATFEEMSDLPTNSKYALRISQTSNFNYDHFLTFYSGQGVPLIRGDDYTMSVWCKRVSGSNLKLSLQIGTTSYISSGDLPVPADNDWHRYTWTFTAPSGDNYYYANTSNSRAYVGGIRNVTSAYEVLFCGWKLEKGNKATDWTSAPEDVQGEIDAKKSAHTLMSASTTGATYANILAWTAEGRENTSWAINTTATPLTNVKIGDTCRVAYKVSDMNGAYVYVVGELTSISGNTIYMTMHGLDTTIIDGGNILTNSIGANQIASNAISVGKMDSDAQSKVLNSNIQIGGRNLFRNTALLGITSLPTNNADTTFEKDWVRGCNSPSAWNITKFDDGINQIEITLNSTSNLGICFARLASDIDIDPTSDYTMSCWAKCTVSGAKLALGLSYYKTSNEWVWRGGTNLQNFNSTSTWQKFTLTFKPDSDTKGLNYCFTCNNGTSGGTGKLYIRQCKLEKGNKPTEWSPAPEDVQESINALDNNILVDADAPTLTSVNGVSNRYWSDAGNTQITCSNFVLTDAPEQGLLYGRRFVCDGTQTSAIARGYAFYVTTDNVIPLVPNKTYTVSWWARCTSGSGQTYLIWSKGDGATTLSSSPKYALSRYWKKITVSFTFGSAVNTNYNRIWFDSYFPANTAGTVEICGCKLVAGGEAEAYITRIDDNGIKVHAANNSNSNYAAINANGMQIFKGGVSVASYGDTSRVGEESGAHLDITADSISGISSSGNEYFQITEAGGTSTNWSYIRIDNAGAGYITNTSVGIGFNLATLSQTSAIWNALSSGASFRIKTEYFGMKTAGGDLPVSKYKINTDTFTKGTASNTTYTQYSTPSTATTKAAYPTLPSGWRTFVGKRVYFGYSTTVNLPYYRMGVDTAESGGGSSVAMGTGTIADGDNQLALGKYNAAGSNALVVVGYGSSASSRSNVLTISKSGAVDSASYIYAGDGIISYGDVSSTNGYRSHGNSSVIGTVKETWLSSAKSVAHNTAVALFGLTLEAGVWVVTGLVRAPSNATGIRVMNISTTSGSNAYEIVMQAVSGTVTQLHQVKIFKFTSTTTIYLNVIQQSGGALSYPAGSANGQNSLTAVRIQ